MRLAVDSRGDVYVADLQNGRIEKFDSSGGFLLQWSTSDSIFSPTAIAVQGDSLVYVTDVALQRVLRFGPDGKTRGGWGSAGEAEGQFDFPMGIALDGQGVVYIADRNNHRIQKFTSTGAFLLSWDAGRPREGPRFWGPHDLVVAPDGTLLMVEWHGYQVWRYSSDGKLLDQWGTLGISEGRVDNVYGIAIDTRGDVYLTEVTRPRVVKYHDTGEFVVEWGKRGKVRGQFVVPWGIALGRKGEVFVADSFRNVILKFEPQ